jgi:hypothetical protein
VRILSILFNPIGHLIWWIARTLGSGIDRRLGPSAGWVVAWVLMVLSFGALSGALYACSENIAKLAGLKDREPVTLVEGRVVSAETTLRKTMTVQQDIVAQFNTGGGVKRIQGAVTEPVSSEYTTGDAIKVYVTADGKPSLRHPEDPLMDAVLAAVGLAVPALALFFSFRYWRYRGHLRQRVKSQTYLRSKQPDLMVMSGVVMRGRQKVKSHAERLQEDAEIRRRMHEKAKNLQRR